jgi:NAD(P)-dependent dehydrogenase (short-subunit alcohol dehydrogenase family)
LKAGQSSVERDNLDFFKQLQEAVKHIRSGGSIVFISSVAAFNPTAPLPFYGVSKTALLGVTRVSDLD